MASDKLDVEVATKVMGWKKKQRNGRKFWEDQKGNARYSLGNWWPSRALYQSWMVIERMRELGFEVSVCALDKKGAKEDESGSEWSCDFTGNGIAVVQGGDRAQDAICRAAVEAVKRMGA